MSTHASRALVRNQFFRLEIALETSEVDVEPVESVPPFLGIHTQTGLVFGDSSDLLFIRELEFQDDSMARPPAPPAYPFNKRGPVGGSPRKLPHESVISVKLIVEEDMLFAAIDTAGLNDEPFSMILDGVRGRRIAIRFFSGTFTMMEEFEFVSAARTHNLEPRISAHAWLNRSC